MAMSLLALPVVLARPSVAPVKTRPVVSTGDRPLNVDWPKYCADAAMTGRAHNEAMISAASVASMKLAWKVLLPGPVASSPTVVSGRVYVGDWAGYEWELDAASGDILASANVGTTPLGNCAPPVQGVTSAPSFDRGNIYLAGGDDSFYALDAGTLQTIWKTKLGDNSPSGGYYGWCSPSPLDGRIYQGISSHCDDPFVDGRVVALDGRSGSILSIADLAQTSDPTRFGAGVWSSPAIDVGAGNIFVTTASAYAYDDGLAYSIVRLSLESLAIADFWKIPLADYNAVPDADWGSSPTLFRDSGGRLLVGAGQKDGNYYAFSRANLSAGPVWKTAIAVAGDCPQCGQGVLSTAAFDGERIFVGGGKPPDSASPPPPASSLGAVTALDPASGAVLWRFANFLGPVIAPISSANDVIFAAGGALCAALDASTGAVLWQARGASDLYGGVAISDGRIFFGDTAGYLYAFEVPRPSN